MNDAVKMTYNQLFSYQHKGLPFPAVVQLVHKTSRRKNTLHDLKMPDTTLYSTDTALHLQNCKIGMLYLSPPLLLPIPSIKFIPAILPHSWTAAQKKSSLTISGCQIETVHALGVENVTVKNCGGLKQLNISGAKFIDATGNPALKEINAKKTGQLQLFQSNNPLLNLSPKLEKIQIQTQQKQAAREMAHYLRHKEHYDAINKRSLYNNF